MIWFTADNFHKKNRERKCTYILYVCFIFWSDITFQAVTCLPWCYIFSNDPPFWLACWFLLSPQWVQMWPVIIHLLMIQKWRAGLGASDWQAPSGSWFYLVYIYSWPCNSCLLAAWNFQDLIYERASGPLCNGESLPHVAGRGRSEYIV